MLLRNLRNSTMNNEDGVNLKPRTKRIRPLRVLIIEPNDSYFKSVCYAIAIGISQIMIGATVMTVLIYSIVNNDVHAALCAFAYHFFAVEAILSINFGNGWSTSMQLRHRVFSHVFLQTIGVICGIIGTVIIIIEKGFSVTGHGLSGFITTIFICLAFAIGPCALFGRRNMKILHTAFGIPAFILSSICFCFGVFTESFRNWTHPAVSYIVTAFIIFYTICILIMCFIKCSIRIRQ